MFTALAITIKEGHFATQFLENNWETTTRPMASTLPTLSFLVAIATLLAPQASSQSANDVLLVITGHTYFSGRGGETSEVEAVDFGGAGDCTGALANFPIGNDNKWVIEVQHSTNFFLVLMDTGI